MIEIILFDGVQLFMKVQFCYLEYLDSLGLGDAKSLISWSGLYVHNIITLHHLNTTYK